jgi:hypothetical protein
MLLINFDRDVSVHMPFHPYCEAASHRYPVFAMRDSCVVKVTLIMSINSMGAESCTSHNVG